MGYRGTGKGYLTSHGYRVIGSRETRRYEHRLIWEKHYGPIPPNYVIHHKDDNRQNNSLDNLELMSKAQHQQHHREEISKGKLASDKSYKPKGELHHNAKFTDKLVKEIRERLIAGELGSNLAKEFKVWPTAISRIKNRTRWPHI